MNWRLSGHNALPPPHSHLHWRRGRGRAEEGWLPAAGAAEERRGAKKKKKEEEERGRKERRREAPAARGRGTGGRGKDSGLGA